MANFRFVAYFRVLTLNFCGLNNVTHSKFRLDMSETEMSGILKPDTIQLAMTSMKTKSVIP